jgi:hypothetical protein
MLRDLETAGSCQRGTPVDLVRCRRLYKCHIEADSKQADTLSVNFVNWSRVGARTYHLILA